MGCEADPPDSPPVLRTATTEAIDLRQPKGFVSYFTRARRLRRRFRLRSARGEAEGRTPAISDSTASQFRAGLRFRPLHVINDNAGRLFHFSPLRPGRTRWSTSMRPTQPRKSTPCPWRTPLAPAARRRPLMRARVDQRDGHDAAWHTRLWAWPRGRYLALPPGQGRALFSRFHASRAAAVYLDIQDYELKAGIRSQEDPALGTVIGQIFLSDTLENGAGYATHLGTPGVTQELLEMISGLPRRQFHDRLVDPPTPTRATRPVQTACEATAILPTTICSTGVSQWTWPRSRSTPWRRYPLHRPRWLRVANIAALTLQNARPGYNRIAVAGLPAITNGTEVYHRHSSAVAHRTGCAWAGAGGRLGRSRARPQSSG